MTDSDNGFRNDAANTNSNPIYVGKLMLFSDQDLTSLKHNLVYTGVVSTVFVGLIGTISNPQIPLVWRALLLGVVLTGLHSVCIAFWNLMQSGWQVYPQYSPGAALRFIGRKAGRVVLAIVVCAVAIHAYGPATFESFTNSLRLMGIA